VGERDAVLARGFPRDDDALAGIAIHGGRMHLRRGPGGLAVTGEECRDALHRRSVEMIVGGQRGMADDLPRGERAILGGGVDLLRPLLARVGIADGGKAREKAGEVAEEIELVAQPMKMAARHRRARVRSRRRAYDHLG